MVISSFMLLGHLCPANAHWIIGHWPLVIPGEGRGRERDCVLWDAAVSLLKKVKGYSLKVNRGSYSQLFCRITFTITQFLVPYSINTSAALGVTYTPN
jgi:hypothetical protein